MRVKLQGLNFSTIKKNLRCTEIFCLLLSAILTTTYYGYVYALSLDLLSLI